ncbi:DDE_3 domain-containing protein [Trichonephila clavipes]|nr:DDE_3 domain-containing protein [Trichonephila clavipes]
MRGTLTGQRYVDDIPRPHVGPFLNGLPGVIFQQDNARPHSSRVGQDYLRHFQTLPGPARSPDWSPVEHVGDQLKRQMPLYHSVHDLDLAVQDLWAHLPQDNIRCLINSMPNRVTACISAGGGPRAIEVAHGSLPQINLDVQGETQGVLHSSAQRVNPVFRVGSNFRIIPERKIIGLSGESRDIKPNENNRFPNRNRQEHWRETKGNNRYADHGDSSKDLRVKVLGIIGDSMVDAEGVKQIIHSTIKAVDKLVREIMLSGVRMIETDI